MAQHNCEDCPMRKKYDKSPGSLLGRFWRWHINFCPGWRKYIGSLDHDQKQIVKEKYQFKKY